MLHPDINICDRRDFRDVLVAHVLPELTLKALVKFCRARKSLQQLLQELERDGSNVLAKVAKRSLPKGHPALAVAPGKIFATLRQLGQMHDAVHQGHISLLPPATLWQGTSDDFPAASLASHSGRLLISQHAGQLLLHQQEPSAPQSGPSLIFAMDLPECTDVKVVEENWIQMAWAPDDSCVVIWMSIRDYGDDRSEFNESGCFDIVYMLDMQSKQLQEVCHTSEIATLISPHFAPDSQSLAVPWFSYETNGIFVQLFRRSDPVSTACSNGTSAANSNAGLDCAQAQKDARQWRQVARFTEKPADGRSMPQSISSISPDSKRLAIAHWGHAVVYDLSRPVDKPAMQTPEVQHGGPYSKTRVKWLADDCLMLWTPGKGGAIHCFQGDELQGHISHTADLSDAVLESMQTVTATASRLVATDLARKFQLPHPTRTMRGLCAHACIMRLPQQLDSGQQLLVSDLPDSHAAPVLSPDGAFLALVSREDKQLCIYNMKTGQQLLQLALPESLAFKQIALDNVFSSKIRLAWPLPGQHILISCQLRCHQPLEKLGNDSNKEANEEEEEEESNAESDKSTYLVITDQLTICKLG